MTAVTGTLATWLLEQIQTDYIVALSHWVFEDVTWWHEVASARGPGWFEAECNFCDWTTSGYENAVEDYAHEHAVAVHAPVDQVSWPGRRFPGCPVQLLIECEAKRRIVKDMSAAMSNFIDDGEQYVAEHVLAVLALPYADREGYRREEWAP